MKGSGRTRVGLFNKQVHFQVLEEATLHYTR